jgi:hypothetical protein
MLKKFKKIKKNLNKTNTLKIIIIIFSNILLKNQTFKKWSGIEAPMECLSLNSTLKCG